MSIGILRFGIVATIVAAPAAPAFGQNTLIEICYYAPSKASRAELDRLLKAFEDASATSRPTHVLSKLERVKSAKPSCDAIIDLTLDRSKPGAASILILKANDRDNKAILSTTIELVLKEVEAPAFEHVWKQIWDAIAPPPPPPPPPPDPAPVADKPFVDQELIAETTAAHTQPATPARAKLAAIYVGAGFYSRALDGGPGLPIERANLLSLELDGTLSLAPLLDTKTIELELGAAYARRLAEGETGVDITADRIQARAALRYVFGASSVGVLAGWELLRFELNPESGALSVRWSVVRAGLSARQIFAEFDGHRVTGFLDGAARIAPGADGGEAGVGFDAGLGVRLELANGFLARIGGEYVRQSGTVTSTEVVDETIQAGAAVGWAL